MKSLKDLGRSISSKLSLLAKKENVAFQHIATTFLIERMVVRITSNPELQKHLVFKGGYVSLRVYGSSRYTIDLDALLLRQDMTTILDQARASIEKPLEDGVWFYHVNNQPLQTQGEHGGMRLIYRAGYGEPPEDIKRAQLIHFDIGLGDPIVPEPRQLNTPSMITDVPVSWQVYPLEMTVAEKLHALCERGSFNSRSKDIYDLYIFLPRCDPAQLKTAIESTFCYRNTPMPGNWDVSLRKIDTSILKKGWISAVSDVEHDLKFDVAFDGLVNELKKLIRE